MVTGELVEAVGSRLSRLEEFGVMFGISGFLVDARVLLLLSWAKRAWSLSVWEESSSGSESNSPSVAVERDIRLNCHPIGRQHVVLPGDADQQRKVHCVAAHATGDH